MRCLLCVITIYSCLPPTSACLISCQGHLLPAPSHFPFISPAEILLACYLQSPPVVGHPDISALLICLLFGPFPPLSPFLVLPPFLGPLTTAPLAYRGWHYSRRHAGGPELWLQPSPRLCAQASTACSGRFCCLGFRVYPIQRTAPSRAEVGGRFLPTRSPCRMPVQLTTALRVVGTSLFALAVLGGILAAYVTGYQFIHTEKHYLSFGLYGAILGLHLLIQSLFAFLEHRRMRRAGRPLKLPSPSRRSVALCIAAYQEDPDYLRKCLRSAQRIAFPNLKVVMVVDGNRQEDSYMLDIFHEVLGGTEQAGFFVWRSNFHEAGEGETEASLQEGMARVRAVVQASTFSCIMQKWGGKREVMYTAFKALGESVDYIQVCDSDTVLDPACTIEMLRVLEEDPQVGGVGGDVQILNKYDSWISFLSSVRYWMAFNVERACQSYFGCVQCISGPLGMYRNSLLQQFLEDWYHQKFLGSKCSFGDDRHLTNRVLSLGYRTKYTARSKCLTETPTKYLRWLNQQTRWSKSYFREWLYNSLWFHKHHLWMTYESVVTGFFPFFLIATVIQLFYRGRIWNILLFLLTVQLVGIIKATYACFLRGNAEMIFMSLYSLLYMSSLLPAKIFAIATINKSGWGTSGRKTIVVNFIGLIPVSIWVAVLLGGLAYTAYCQDLFSETELAFLVSGAVLYGCYWVALLMLYLAIIARRCGKKTEQYSLAFAEV
ncbi:hyaluronan synthase 3 isoform X1 [Rhinolophus sinicus]|uniref:hyaluronan synthase 3 isoform X1 n=2 Tax=Rhinolophus sinicus TaxID=89399 RepID=UPI003D7B6234